MWAAGVFYITIGSLYFLTKKLNLQSNFISQRIYLALFFSGISIELISILKFLLSDIVYMISCAAIVMIMGLYVLRLVNRWMVALATIDKLSQ